MIDTEEISCIFLFLDLVIGPILVMETDPPPEELLDPMEEDDADEQVAAAVMQFV